MTYDKFKLLTLDDLEHIKNHYHEFWHEELDVNTIPFLHPDRLRLMLFLCDRKRVISKKLGLELISSSHEAQILRVKFGLTTWGTS